MFDPANLEIIETSHRPGNPAFVGIRQREGKTEFCLPQGFDEYPVQVRQERRDLFFQLYQTLNIFQRDLESRVSTYDHVNDTGYISSEGVSFVVEDEGEEQEVTLYAKIPALEAVLDGYDSLRIFRVIGRPRRTETVDYSQIHRYLDRAVYLEGDVAHVDEMVLPQATLSYSETDIVKMFCFIYTEVKQALGELESMRPEVMAYGREFKHDHLYPDSSLFTDSHDRTIQLLKRLLNRIHLEAGYKDADYWHFYDAVETFLFGKLDPDEGGTLWGISSFAPVWEDMCMVWVFESDKSSDNIAFADPDRQDYCSDSLGDGQNVFIDSDFTNPFFIERKGVKRFMRPDLVRRPESSESLLDRFFRITKRNGKYSISLKQKSDLGYKYFGYLVDEICKLYPGAKRPSKKQGFWSFHLPDPSYLKHAKSEFSKKVTRSKNPGTEWNVFDFKYKPAYLYQQSRLRDEEVTDVKKQAIYEYALQLEKPSASTASTIDIPRYFSEPISKIGEPVCDSTLNRLLQKLKVSVFEVDYMKIERFYRDFNEPKEL